LRLRLNNIEEILGWVLSWGAHAMVVRPTRLAQRVYAAAKEMLARYSEVGESAAE
jgi:predicted DNA-binding transcriptional regulator YafY